MSGPAVDDCFRHDERVLTHDEAIAMILARVPPIEGTERRPVEGGLARVLAEDVVAPRNVPMTDTSAVDGWAFAHADLIAAGGEMPVSGRIMAGRAAEEPLRRGTATRIFTGAAMPAGADTVAMQEDCRPAGDPPQHVVIPTGLRPGANRRRAGEDVATGTAVVGAGTVLRPQELAAIASLGVAAILVRRPLRIALLSTGDEILRPGAPIRPGEVYDANFVLLSSLTARPGFAVTDLGVLPDRRDDVFAAMAAAAASHDVVVTSGGTGHGEGDQVAAAIEALGRRHLWQLAIKPGRPLSLGQIGDAITIGLPGNPVAALVSFLLYGEPLLARRRGASWRPPVRYPLPAAFDMPARKTGRREFLRGILVTGPDGRLAVDKYGRDGSGLISGLRAADGLIEIAEDVDAVREGEAVAFLPFTEFGLPQRQPGL